jgi:hypothetical protein
MRLVLFIFGALVSPLALTPGTHAIGSLQHCEGASPSTNGCTLEADALPGQFTVGWLEVGPFVGFRTVAVHGTNGGFLEFACASENLAPPNDPQYRCTLFEPGDPPGGHIVATFYNGIDDLSNIITGLPSTPQMPAAIGPWYAYLAA